MTHLAISIALAGPAVDVEPSASTDLPAEEAPPEESIWDYIESTEAAPEVEEAAELVAERLAELSFTGQVGAPPPRDYYRDPVAATARDPLQLDRVDPGEFDIPVVVNDEVKKWMSYFLGPGRRYYTRYLQRSTKWLPMMRAKLAARGMPGDLVYLSMIESGFSVGATSYASAAGLWQFMPATARQYGLRVDWWVDERRDPERATDAALTYLAYLAKFFGGDWWLAWAGYNGGEGRVLRATQRYGTADFWAIASRDYLHTETANYVPKLLAAAILGKHPERYGFVGLAYEPAWTFDSAEVPNSTSIDVLARCAGISEEEFLALNPAHRRWALAPDPETHTIRLPAGSRERFADAFAKVPPAERIRLVRHVVKRGESLGAIAKRYGVTAEDVARLNKLKSKNRIRVGMELVIPAEPARSAAASDKAPPAVAAVTRTVEKERISPVAGTPEKPATRDVMYTVRSGDSLGKIAAKHGTTVEKLQAWNGIRGHHIEAGQELVVGKAAVEPTAPAPKSSKYTVRRGDTLGGIAERYGCTVEQLKAWNQLRGTTIYAGQVLVIRG
jgi:membrane-bound lytic murein transglycosylase D